MLKNKRNKYDLKQGFETLFTQASKIFSLLLTVDVIRHLRRYLFLFCGTLESYFNVLKVSASFTVYTLRNHLTFVLSFLVTTTPDGQMKIVKNVVVPNQTVVSGKNTLTSLLTSNNTKLAGRRILMTKGPDGTTRVITGTANILPKNLQNSQQSLIKTTVAGQSLQTAQIQPGK